jgi:hypothetical protein
MVRALAELEGFQQKQGNRAVAAGREINLSDYVSEKKTDQPALPPLNPDPL